MTRRLSSSLVLALCAVALVGCETGAYNGYAPPYAGPAYPPGYTPPLPPPVPYAPPQPPGWGYGYPAYPGPLNDPRGGGAWRSDPYADGRGGYRQPWDGNRPEPPTTFRDEYGRQGEGYIPGTPGREEFGRGRDEAPDGRWNYRPEEPRRGDDRAYGQPEQGYSRPDLGAPTWR